MADDRHRGRRSATERELQRIFDMATAYVQQHYGEQVDLGVVARHAYTSRRQLQRAFQAVGGTTFRSYVRAVRMDIARRALETSPELTIRDVAFHVGYRQPAQFAKAFRAHHGHNPSEMLTGPRG